MRAMLFDLDGVLVDSFAVWHAVLDAFAAKRGYPKITDRAMADGWGQGVDADARGFFPGTSVAELEAFFNNSFLDHVEHLVIMPGVGDLFAGLRAGDVLTAVVTNTPAPLAGALLRRAGALPDFLVGGTDVARPKPAPDMVLKACEGLSVSPSEAAMVGDSEFDRQAAQAAGVHFIGFRCAGDSRVDELQELLGVLGLR